MESNIQNVFKIITELHESEREVQKNDAKKITQTMKKYYIVLAVLFVLLLICVGIYQFYQCESIKTIAIIFQTLIYLVVLSSPFIFLIQNRDGIKTFFTNPFSLIVNQAEKTILHDSNYLNKLKKIPLKDLKFLKMQLEQYREQFFSRMHLLIGSLDKIGIFPGIISLLLSRYNEEYSQVFYIFSFSIICIYMFVLVFKLLFQRLERVLCLINHIIDERKE